MKADNLKKLIALRDGLLKASVLKNQESKIEGMSGIIKISEELRDEIVLMLDKIIVSEDNV